MLCYVFELWHRTQVILTLRVLVLYRKSTCKQRYLYHRSSHSQNHHQFFLPMVSLHLLLFLSFMSLVFLLLHLQTLSRHDFKKFKRTRQTAPGLTVLSKSQTGFSQALQTFLLNRLKLKGQAFSSFFVSTKLLSMVVFCSALQNKAYKTTASFTQQRTVHIKVPGSCNSHRTRLLLVPRDQSRSREEKYQLKGVGKSWQQATLLSSKLPRVQQRTKTILRKTENMP